MRTLLLAVALCSLPALAADARKPTTLDSAFTPKLGDFIALEISAAFASLKTIDAPIIVGYDAEKKKLMVLVVGSRAQPEAAREVIDKLVELVALMSPEYQKQRGVALGDDNVVYVYRNKANREVDLLKREGGKYTP
ncbi:MAG: hypothetical protein U0228_35470 [Myxococcaceae bacterium]